MKHVVRIMNFFYRSVFLTVFFFYIKGHFVTLLVTTISCIWTITTTTLPGGQVGGRGSGTVAVTDAKGKRSFGGLILRIHCVIFFFQLEQHFDLGERRGKDWNVSPIRSEQVTGGSYINQVFYSTTFWIHRKALSSVFKLGWVIFFLLYFSYRSVFFFWKENFNEKKSWWSLDGIELGNSKVMTCSYLRSG